MLTWLCNNFIQNLKREVSRREADELKINTQLVLNIQHSKRTELKHGLRFLREQAGTKSLFH
jgi:hypothetical protein